MSHRIKMSIIKTVYYVEDKTVKCCITVKPQINGTPYISYIKQFYGVAKCNENDDFNFNFGKKLALARAELKARKYYKKVFGKIAKKYQEALRVVSNFCEDCKAQIEHNNNYIIKLTY